MVEATSVLTQSVSSPRSAFVKASGCMTTALPVIMNEGNIISDVASPEKKIASNQESGGTTTDATSTSTLSNKDSERPSNTPEVKGENSTKSIGTTTTSKSNDQDRVSPPTPSTQDYQSGTPQLSSYSNLTPGYYMGYPALQPNHNQMTPEPASPAPPPYDPGSFFQPLPGATFPTSGTSGATTTVFAVPSRGGTSNGGGIPLSPPRATVVSGVSVGGGLPPSSPLFPRIASTGSNNARGGAGLDVNPGQRAPNLPYMPPPATTNTYLQYPSGGVSSQSSDEGGTWGASGDNRNQNSYPSPQIGGMHSMPYGVPPLGRAMSGGRTYSFDESGMLPPGGLDDPANPAYSPYSQTQSSPGGAAIFQQPWGYGAPPPPDPYGTTPASPLQPRPALHQPPMYQGMPSIRAPMPPYGPSYYPASSPGPPIQTTASNKGPDGANLFIFHIPNHFTNLDMYQLFVPYGNLLSVRIMVEKETGRSRGFGFVSYDNPDSAAVAIKELNGFPIGNKRLKVQHKQIKRQDNSLMHDPQSREAYGDGFPPYNQQEALPPSAPGSTNDRGSNDGNMWYESSSGVLNESSSAPEHHGQQAQYTQQQQHQQPHQQDDSGVAGGEHNVNNELHGGEGGENEQNATSSSPLANLGQLQSALPDIAGKGNSQE